METLITGGLLMDGEAFTAAEADKAGISRWLLADLVAAGQVRRLLHDAYVDALVADTVELRAQALCKVMPASGVVARRTAAWLFGIDAYAPHERDQALVVECVVPGREARVRRKGVRGWEETLEAGDISCVHGVRVTTPTRTALDLARYAPRFMGLAAVDAFGKLSMARLGEVVRERDMPADVPEHPEVAAFSERHGLYHCMALTAELPDSGLMFFVSVYRPPHRTGFTDAETVLFGEFVFHLLQHWHHLLQRLQSSSPGRPWDSFALAEPSGELLFAGLRISMALGEAVMWRRGPTTGPQYRRTADPRFQRSDRLRFEHATTLPDPAKARLILIRGEGMDGLSYHLKADQHVVGRSGQVEFPDDPFVSPKHANFFYRDDRLVVVGHLPRRGRPLDRPGGQPPQGGPQQGQPHLGAAAGRPAADVLGPVAAARREL